MDPTLLDVIRVKVHAFRISEAKEVLTQLGLPKHGRKEELHARILTIFQDAATLTAQGHKLRDQARVDSAAAIVDSVFRRLLRSEYAPAVTAAHKLRAQGQFTDADADNQQGPNKRPRIGNPLMPHHRTFNRAAGAGSAGVRSDVDEVITAFVNGEEDIGPSNTKVRCVCTQHVRKEPMLQCEGPFCGVWQHAACVKQQLLHSQLVPHLPGSDKWPKRRQFFCERCRIARADPFWEVYDTLVMPPQLGKATAGRMRVQNYHNQSEEWTVSMAGPAKVNLSSSQLRLLRDSPHEYQLQAMALCLDDQVQFRTQWPTAPMLRWGTRQLRVVNRTNGTALGVMQRDAPANLTPLLPLAGVQQDSGGMTLDLSLEYADPKHTVLLLAYIMRRRTREQVKALMRAPEPLAAAVQRVRNFVKPRGAASSTTNPAAAAANGPRHQQQQQQQPAAAAAAAAGHDDIVISDEDDDIVVGNRVVSLKDPNTFSRIKQPARFTDTSSNDLLAFELESFLDVAEKTLKWIDPHSMKASCIQNLQVDTYLAQVLAGLAQQPDVLEVEINEDAEWRPAGSTGPFISVLDPNAAALAAAAAGGGGDLTSDEEDEAAELRRAASEMRRGKQHEVIELLDSDDEAPPQQQQQQQPAAAGGGLRIQLPSRAAQQQTHLQQQVAMANMAAAAVGPQVPHAAPGMGAHLQGGVGGVMSPRVVAGNLQPQQQQQQQAQWQQQQGLPPQQQQQQQQQQQFVGNLPPEYTLQRVGSGVPQQQQQQQQPGAPPPRIQYAQVVGPGMVQMAGNQLYIPVVSSGGMLLGPGGVVLQGGLLQAGGQQVQLQMAQGQQGYLQQQPGQVVYLPQQPQQQQQQQHPPQGHLGH